ncbi:transcriptional regulator [Candidatus Pacearchaeota archaeon]|nr:transcriptional regulator [Candidatus Pacearchaeota archaeon]|tara:strand:- start:1256 stop:1513 length:258 start_codon:yes stop_codon:yes gene_type:complete
MSSGFTGAQRLQAMQTVTAKQVAAWLGVNRSTIYRYVEERGFPKPVILSPRRQVFVCDEVIEWFRQRQENDIKVEEIRNALLAAG